MIITNSNILTWDDNHSILNGYSIVIKNSVIQEIGASEFILSKYPDEEIFDARGKILMPGFICAHTHFYGVFSRGLYIPGTPPRDFPEILEKLWWPLDSSLLAEDVKYSALVCLIDAIKHGTTTLFDHHASPLCIEGSLDEIESAFITTGVRGVVCYETTDRYGTESRDQSVKENLRMIEKVKSADTNESLVSATFGLHASLTLTEDTLEIVRNSLPDGVGVHIHVAEHGVDEDDSIMKTGKRVVERLEKHQLLGQDSILVHGVHLDETEIKIVKDTNSWLTHQPRSNMNNAVGMADVEKMLELGIPVCLGNDGFSNAMLEEWRTCYLAHKLWTNNPQKMNGNSVLKMAVENNSRLVSHFFSGSKIGRVEVGAKADLILVDYNPITELNSDNLAWHIIFGFRDSMVTDTMVNGKWLMNERKLTNLNEEMISAHALSLSKEVWKRYHAKFA
jgi:putative selenium metabolism protein SsnA